MEWAVAGGADRIRLAYVRRNSRRQKLVEHYTVELKRVYQKHHHTDMGRPLRAVQWVTPTGTYVPLLVARGFDSPPFALPFHHDAPFGLPEWL